MADPDYIAVVILPNGDTREIEGRIYLAPFAKSWYDDDWHATAVHIDRAAKRVWYEEDTMT